MNKNMNGYGYIRERQNKDGSMTYQAAAYHGKDVLGKPKYSYKSFASYEEAQKALEEMAAKIILNKSMPVGGNMSLQRFIDDEFLPLYAVKNKPSTIRTYTQMGKFICASPLSKKSLNTITTTNLQAFFNSLYDKSTLSDNGLSARTIMDIRRFVHMLYEQAIACGYSDTNPCKGTKLRRDNSGVMDRTQEVYNREEIRELLKAAKGTDMECILLITLECGLRRGEAVALKYSDFNPDDGTISIQRNAVEDVNGKTVISDPKTMSSRRTVALSDYCQSKIKESNVEYKKLKLRLGTDFVDSDCILHNKNGSMLNAHSLTTKWNRFTESNNLRHIKFHGLRKTAATNMLKNHMDVKSVSNRLGHKNIDITLEIYTAIDDDMKATNVAIMDAFYDDVVNE